MIWILVFIVPVVLVWYPIYCVFDPKLTINQKIFCFLLLPAFELTVSPFAILSARSMEINLMEQWQLYLWYFLFSLGMASTLMVTLLEELESNVKLVLRLTTLSVLGFILTWGFLAIK